MDQGKSTIIASLISTFGTVLVATLAIFFATTKGITLTTNVNVDNSEASISYEGKTYPLQTDDQVIRREDVPYISREGTIYRLSNGALIKEENEKVAEEILNNKWTDQEKRDSDNSNASGGVITNMQEGGKSVIEIPVTDSGWKRVQVMDEDGNVVHDQWIGGGESTIE